MCGELQVQNYSLHHINALVRDVDADSSWTLTEFYGYPEAAHRDKGWKLLKLLKSFNPHSWLCLWDFNEILCQSKNCGIVWRS